MALLLPDDLTEGELADGIQRALVHSRDALADQARRNADLAEQEGRDDVHRAYLIGGSHPFTEATARIDAAVAEVFEVQDPGHRRARCRDLEAMAHPAPSPAAHPAV